MAVAPLLVLSGSPGGGKTTVAALLATRWERGVHLVGDELWRWIRSGFVPPHLPESHAQNVVVARALGAAAAEYAAGGFGVVLDTIVAPWALPEVAARPHALGIDVHYVVLRPRLHVALDRAASRDAGDLTDPAVVEQMWHAVADLGPYEHHVVDPSDLTVEEVVDAVWARLVDGSCRTLPR